MNSLFRLASRVWHALAGLIERLAGGTSARADAGTRAHEFHSDAAAIEEAPVPVSAYTTLYVVLGLLTAAIVWSVVGSVDRIVVARGRVVTTAPVIVMQPFTTSRILKIHVKAGDRVTKGQVLVSFDPAFAAADKSSMEQKVRALAAETARIEAELSGRGRFLAGDASDSETRAQAELFGRRTAQFTAEQSVRDNRQRQIEAQIASNDSAIVGLRRQLELAQRVSEIRTQLRARDAGSTLEVMVAERDEIDLNLRLQNALGDNERLKAQRAELVAERQSFLNQWRGELNQRLVAARQEQAQAVEALNKARRMDEFTEMTASEDAVVLELAERSEGSVLREAETLITLVPVDADLSVEADVLSRDVGFISVNDPVRVKLEAYPFQQYGTLDGTLAVLSPDSVPVRGEDKSNVVFHATVRLTQTVGSLVERGIRLRPGLIATAEIKAGTRSIASYVLDPVVGVLDESMTEP